MNSTSTGKATGRRQFLKSLFGLSQALEAKPAKANGQKKASAFSGSFFWADLKTGQVGFPTGTKLALAMPGSTMKLVSAAALCEDGLLSFLHKYECPGQISLDGKSYRCEVAHGNLDMIQALGYSCNVFFAQAAKLLTGTRLLHFARKLGLAEAVCGFQPGLLPQTPGSDLAPLVLGLAGDLKVQPLQLLRLAALIAGRGSVVGLHSAEQTAEPGQAFSVSFQAHTWHVLDQGMQLACREGTAKNLDPENKLLLAVKTGTVPEGKDFQSWICGYFPHQAPRYAFCAHAHKGTSHDAAVPLAHQFLFATEWPL